MDMRQTRFSEAALPDPSSLMKLIGVLEARHQTDRIMIEAFAQAIGKRMEKVDEVLTKVNASLSRSSPAASPGGCRCGHEKIWHLPLLTEESGPGTCGFCLGGCSAFSPDFAAA